MTAIVSLGLIALVVTVVSFVVFFPVILYNRWQARRNDEINAETRRVVAERFIERYREPQILSPDDKRRFAWFREKMARK